MINGAHTIIYSTSPDADRAFLRDVLELTNVDAGDGWLIFGLPPAEVAVHPSEMNEHGVTSSPVQDEGWGSITQLTLPGGGKLGVYQPRHARPEPMTA